MERKNISFSWTHLYSFFLIEFIDWNFSQFYWPNIRIIGYKRILTFAEFLTIYKLTGPCSENLIHTFIETSYHCKGWFFFRKHILNVNILKVEISFWCFHRRTAFDIYWHSEKSFVYLSLNPLFQKINFKLCDDHL